MAEPPMVERAGWDWLEAPPLTGPIPTAAAGTDPAPSFARCFAGTDGARVLAVLRAMTLDRALGPDAPEAALRHLEGQRQLVATILALVARGRAG
ncbi:hypothetical protein F1643_01385 [Azospirillum sp. INR13]|uniref:Bbp19 family protein n=1 Tax=unclassified Azospirillum TaxID=2630922 RepID=UPI0011EF7D80|nr:MULTISPECIES: hypothetical protein [unclassified Azospirillum]KAA0580444.1 hypothetical protein FZ983_12770 [Azospirillum sp. B21]MBF5093320.1 hypothetical protein [Azospirillum sp. INR13]